MTAPDASTPAPTLPSDAVHDDAASGPPGYGTGTLRGAVTGIAAGGVLVVLATALDTPGVPRSVMLGAGLVAVSSGLTVLVAAQMYRLAPAATAPALAALYLLKVLVLGWLLLDVGAPPWLAPQAFALTVLVAIVLSTAWFAVLVRGITARALREHRASTGDQHCGGTGNQHRDAAGSQNQDSGGGQHRTALEQHREETS